MPLLFYVYSWRPLRDIQAVDRLVWSGRKMALLMFLALARDARRLGSPGSGTYHTYMMPPPHDGLRLMALLQDTQ